MNPVICIIEFFSNTNIKPEPKFFDKPIQAAAYLLGRSIAKHRLFVLTVSGPVQISIKSGDAHQIQQSIEAVLTALESETPQNDQ